MTQTARTLTAIAGLIILAGCAQLPVVRGSVAPVRAPSPAPMASIQPVAPTAPGAGVSAGQAETACLSQGRAQGLAVQGVVGTREVAGADGLPRARDVMLRVARGQQIYEVRCSYTYASAEARIMSL